MAPLLKPLRLDIDALQLSSPPEISLSLVKDHCAVDGTDFDTLVQTYRASALAWAENSAHRSIIAREHRWILADFPRGTELEIRLPRGKTRSVASIAYVDTDGATQALTGPSSSPAGTDYQEDLRGDDGGTLRPPQDDSWPELKKDAAAPVTITFTAGYLASDLPDDLLTAILFAISDSFELRGSADLAGGGPSFQTRETLLSPYRLVRWY